MPKASSRGRGSYTVESENRKKGLKRVIPNVPKGEALLAGCIYSKALKF